MHRSSSMAALALLLVACGSLDGTGKDACVSASDCGAGRACQSMVCVDGDPTQSDSDGDGLLDADELAGWDIDVDERGYGLVVGSEFITRRHVASDPARKDTDGDALDDKVEFTDRTDPTKPDTDGDGLSDGEEKDRWRSNPLSVDSDGDARDPGNNTIPIAALFDGAELTAGTSPTLADTDGDGKSDFEERDVSNRSPRVAEIPQAEIAVAGNITVQMNIEYQDAETVSETYGEEYSTTDASRTSRSDMESTAVTIAASSGGQGFFDDLEFNKEGAIKFFGGKALEMGRSAACQSAASGQIQFDAEHPLEILNPINLVGMLVGLLFEPTGLIDTGICDDPTPETVNTTSTTLTQESSQSATESYSQYRTDSTTRTEVASTGIVSLGFRLRNVGISTFDVVNPTLTMMQWEASPVPDASLGAGAFRTLATLRSIDGGVVDGNGNRTFTLAPNEEVIVQMENRTVNADFIKGFLARPQAIFFSPAQFRMSDRNGADYDYLTEETYNRTAALIIDSGVPSEPTQRYQFATNVMRTETGELAGIRMHDVLTDVLQIPYQTRSVERRASDDRSVSVEELHAIGNLANQRSTNRGDPAGGVAGDPQGLWVIYVKRAEQAAPELPFDDIVFMPGDEVRLVYIRDVDGDGLMAGEEAVYGTSDQEPDSDGDGLSDFVELKVGWKVDIDFELDGQARTVSYRVGSDPANSDPDGDGLTDPEERTLGTDPNNPDTDDDARFDRCDTSPLDPDDASVNGACEPVALYAYVDNNGSQIGMIAIGADGSLSPIGSGSVSTPMGGARQIALTPNGMYAYMANGQNGDTPIHAFNVDPGTGQLSLNPFEQLSLGGGGGLKNWRTVVAHPSGPFVFGADEGPDNDRVQAFRIDSNLQPGRLLPLNTNRDFSNVREMVLDGSGRFLYVIGANRELGILGVDTSTSGAFLGTLSMLSGVTRVEFPDALAASPDGRYLFLAEGVDSIVPMTINGADGGVTPVAGSYRSGQMYISRLVVDPMGRFLYSIAGGALYVHVINPATGSLTEVDADGDANTGFSPVLTGVANLAIDDAGKLLIAVGSTSTRAFRIEPTGMLTLVGELAGANQNVSILSRVP